MELFTFRASGPYIARELNIESKVLLYLFDAVFSSDPANYVSNMFLVAAVYNRFPLPLVSTLSEIDLIPEDKVDEIHNWSQSSQALEKAIEQQLEGYARVLSNRILNVISDLDLMTCLISVSAKTGDGIINLDAVLQRVLRSGEETY